jgi:hypothetical protein
MRQRLNYLDRQISRGDVEVASGDIKQKLSPPQRRQAAARFGDTVDQRSRISGACREFGARGECADRTRSKFKEKSYVSSHGFSPEAGCILYRWHPRTFNDL